MIKIKQYRLKELINSKPIMIEVDPFDSYKQIRIKINHKGIELRETKKGIEIISKQFLAKEGQFIISKIDARNGAMGIVPIELNDAIVTSDFLLYDFNLNIIDPDYFKYITQTSFFNDECNKSSEGSTNRVRLKVDKFLNIQVALPPLPEQQRIISKTESIKVKLDKIKELRAEQTKDINNLLFSKYIETIKDAQWLPMKEVAPIFRRKVELNPDETYFEIGVRSFGRGLFEKPSFKGAELSWQQPYWVKEGDLLFSNIKAWEGAVGLIPKQYDGWVGSHRYITCLPNLDIIEPEFLFYYFRTYEGVEKLNSASPGTADRNRTLNTKMLNSMLVPVPDIKLQKELIALLAKVNAIREYHHQTDHELTEIMPGLLDKAFKGEL